MELRTDTDDGASQASNTSASSMTLQFSAEELQENNSAIAPSAVEKLRKEGKLRRLNRRLALANLQPPKLSIKNDGVVDLRTKEDKMGELSWLKKRFPSININLAEAESIVPHLSTYATAPPSVAKHRSLKQSLEKKLAERRKTGLAKRRELYMEDNEGLFESDEEAEEDDEYGENDGHSSGDDMTTKNAGEDEQQAELDMENSQGRAIEKCEEKECAAVLDLPKSIHSFNGPSSVAGSAAEKGEENQGQPTSTCIAHHVDSLNLMLEDDADVETTGMTQPQFPNSLSQWFGEKPTSESPDSKPRSTETPEFVNVGTFSDLDPFKDSDQDDVLAFCSGRFETQNLAPRVDASVERDDAYSDKDAEVSLALRKKRVLIESDDEGESEQNAANEASFKIQDSEENDESSEITTSKSAEQTTLVRTIVVSDADESDDDEKEELREDANGSDDREEEESDYEDEIEGDDEEKSNESEQREHKVVSEGAGFVDEEAEDSDDELAVIRRLQKEEFKRKVGREKWFDDEASLSGDDFGSDVDDDLDIPNEYEAEEGDNDDIPDAHVIRRQNHKLLLKQEKDREHAEIVKLQERLLADGDLGGNETNRTFRLKLREETTVVENGEDYAEHSEEHYDDGLSTMNARRVEAIKWLIKNEESGTELYDKAEDDIFDVAVRSVRISEEVSISSKTPRTLIGQACLANAIKEVAGGSAVKQLYVNDTSIERKRSSSPTLQPAKKSRASVSVLSILEQA